MVLGLEDWVPKMNGGEELPVVLGLVSAGVLAAAEREPSEVAELVAEEEEESVAMARGAWSLIPS